MKQKISHFFIIVWKASVLLLLPATVVSAYLLSYISRRRLFPLPKSFLQGFRNFIKGSNDTEYICEEWVKQRQDWFDIQHPKHFFLRNASGQKLHAQYIKTERKSKGMILACHGSRSSGKKEFCFISRFLHEQGYDLLLVDHRACGESEGTYMGYGYFESKDTILWIDLIQKQFGSKIPIFLYGISMGAATVMMMSSMKLPENIRGIVADCGYTSAWDELKYQLQESFHMDSFPLLYLVNLLSMILAGYSFKKANPITCVSKSRIPILFIHGEEDNYVPCSMVYELYKACTSPKDLLVIPGAIHAKSYQTNPALYEKKLMEFFRQHSSFSN